MVKKLKTREVLAAWQVLSTAKLGDLKEDQKIAIFRIGQKMKPIATAYADETSDASEQMQPSADFAEKQAKAQLYERMAADPNVTDTAKLPMTPGKYYQFMAEEYLPYERAWKKALRDSGNKEVEIDFAPVSTDVLMALIAPNKWTVDQVSTLASVMCDND